MNTTPPNADAGAGKVITCGNTTVVLSGSSSTANATFAWVASGGGNIVSDANTATPTVNAAGTYTLTVTDPANGCTATNVVLVTVQPCTTFDGCSPGFWKNHETLWNQFTNFPPAHMPAGLKFITTTNYFTYFGITPGSNGMPTNLTMHGAISQGGGGCKALSRHAVSALLSSASGLNIEYPTGTSDFTSLYNAIRAALLSGKCSGPLFSQLEKISDGDHSNCGKFNALRSIHGNSANIETEVIKNISVVSFPNPYNDKVQFTLKSDITGKGVLEVFNAMGQKMQTVFEGNVVAGRSQTIQYNVPANNRTNLIYRFRVGDKTASGKLLKP